MIGYLIRNFIESCKRPEHIIHIFSYLPLTKELFSLYFILLHNRLSRYRFSSSFYFFHCTLKWSTLIDQNCLWNQWIKVYSRGDLSFANSIPWYFLIRFFDETFRWFFNCHHWLGKHRVRKNLHPPWLTWKSVEKIVVNKSFTPIFV
jgi:hypothetical protein